MIDEKLKKLNIVTSGNGTNRDKIQDCEIYVAIVTPSFVSNEFCLGEMRDAKALNKEMYALVDTETKLPADFFNYDWKLIQYYSTDKEFELASMFLKGIMLK